MYPPLTPAALAARKKGKALSTFIWCFFLALVVLALVMGNIGAAAGITIGWVLGWLALSGSYMAENGRWPLAQMRDNWK